MIFQVNEYHKHYLAYTEDDVMDFANINVHFMQYENYESENPKLVPVLESEKKKILEVYSHLINKNH